jgi:hypothetical protein
MLDLLEGQLAEQRGDWDAALAHQRRGYEAKRQHRGYPGHTTATHLRHLVDVSFARRDAEALAHWRRALDDFEKRGEPGHLAAARAHFEAQLDWAAAKDRRLETRYYTDTLEARLQRVADLEP